MKKQLFLILASIIAMTLQLCAQIPNGGFENWTTVNGYFGSCVNPTAWVSSNSYSAGSFYAITKSTDHYPDSVGSYSVRIENNISLSNSTTLTQSYSGRGFISTGTPPPSPNFPVTGHPTSVSGYFKYAPQNGDLALIHIELFKNGTVVSTGEYESGTAFASWTAFTIPLSSYSTADSASVLLAAYRSADLTSLPLGNSVLFVDNINFGAYISPSTTTLSIDTVAKITVASNVSWTAVSNQSWLQLNSTVAHTTNDTITLKATVNPTTAIRTATITFSATGLSQTIKIIQAAGDTNLLISANTASIVKDSNSTTTITVLSNTIWNAISNESWLTISPNTATQDTATLLFTATANPNTTTRIATVTISAQGVTSKTVLVTQAGGIKTGIATFNNDDFTLYPNPTTSTFSINTQRLTTVHIYTINGTLVLNKLVNSNENISTNNLIKGMYVIKIITDNTVTIKTLIVE